MLKNHEERKHSKLSASGSDRWWECPGSVALSEGMPDKSNPAAREGTRAHEILEAIMRIELSGNCVATIEENAPILEHNPQSEFSLRQHREMTAHATNSAKFILKKGEEYEAEVMVETRIVLEHLHPEMFGTFDAAILDYFGTLHIFDFKYGKGHNVSPTANKQMLFYGIGLAHKYEYFFENVRLWIDQPRIKGYNGPMFWEISIDRLKIWENAFRDAVERVEKEPNTYKEGGHCHFCRAKSVCPLKKEKKLEDARVIFGAGVEDLEIL